MRSSAYRWVTEAGVETHPADMETNHLVNALRLVHNNLYPRSKIPGSSNRKLDGNLQQSLVYLLAEASRRILSAEQKKIVEHITKGKMKIGDYEVKIGKTTVRVGDEFSLTKKEVRDLLTKVEAEGTDIPDELADYGISITDTGIQVGCTFVSKQQLKNILR